ncbi:carbohydrate ABC transporter permease [Yoonia sp.]|uniref:carbohydrate ABC transporter permease n=1 Tax=Yoonia sp. TaxID=2212373 RepID=UPI002FDA0AAD
MLGAFYLVPILDVVRLAFGDATLLRGIESYGLDRMSQTLSAPALPGVLWVTLVFTMASVVGILGTGLLIALTVVRGEARNLWGMGLLRTVVLTAWVVPGIANGLIWQMLFSEAPFGALNSTLALLGIAPVRWLSDPDNAMISAVIANVWQGTAFAMIVFYAARKGLAQDLYAAAAVDGAGPFARFLFITLPQMRPAILVASVLVTIQTLNTFDVILALTGGGPGRATEVLSLYTFTTVFYNFDLSGGSVLALILVLIALSLTVVYIRLLVDRRDRQP